MDDCLFCKIIKKEIPSDIVYEDNDVMAFRDIHPVAPIHVLVIPKKHISKVTELTENDGELLGKIYSAINIVVEKEGIKEKGFRIIINCGEDGGQAIGHLHFHILGGKKLGEKIVH